MQYRYWQRRTNHRLYSRVLEAYREAYGELEVAPISFREEIYKNEKSCIRLYPTGSVGIFDISKNKGTKIERRENCK